MNATAAAAIISPRRIVSGIYFPTLFLCFPLPVCASFSLWIRSRLLRIFLFISLNVFAIFTFSLHFYLCVHVCLANLSKYESQLLCAYDAEHLPDTLYHISLREYNHLSWINNLILCNSIQFTYFPYCIH